MGFRGYALYTFGHKKTHDSFEFMGLWSCWVLLKPLFGTDGRTLIVSNHAGYRAYVFKMTLSVTHFWVLPP